MYSIVIWLEGGHSRFENFSSEGSIFVDDSFGDLVPLHIYGAGRAENHPFAGDEIGFDGKVTQHSFGEFVLLFAQLLFRCGSRARHHPSAVDYTDAADRPKCRRTLQF